MSDHQTQEAYDEMHARIHQSENVVVSRIDIETIETAADALIRARQVEIALPLYSFALRLRRDGGFSPQERREDAP